MHPNTVRGAILFGSLAILAAAGIGTGILIVRRPAAVAGPTAPKPILVADSYPGAIPAADLLAEYSTNELAADAKYKGKIIVVTGAVDLIRKSFTDRPYISIHVAGLKSVNLSFPDSEVGRLASLSPGNTVVVRGTVFGLMLGSVQLNDCRLVR